MNSHLIVILLFILMLANSLEQNSKHVQDLYLPKRIRGK